MKSRRWARYEEICSGWIVSSIYLWEDRSAFVDWSDGYSCSFRVAMRAKESVADFGDCRKNNKAPSN